MKALVLFSGGLDSMLAVRLVQKQDIHTEGICFVSTFFDETPARKAARLLDIPLETVDIDAELLATVRSPRHGFGKGANPCIDCHALMLRKAGHLRAKKKAKFLVTGEVLGERPKSQSRRALAIVDKESGFGDYTLRPLSALCLTPTLPERRGWIDRHQLLDIRGRSRKRQLALAEQEGITSFPTPAGGCLLTDPNYARRIKYVLATGKLNSNEAELLKVGRHFHLDHEAHLVIGRNQGENAHIEALATPGDVLLQAQDYAGPVGLLRGLTSEAQIRRAAAFLLRYSDAPPEGNTAVRFWCHPSTQARPLQARPLDPEQVLQARIEEHR